MKLRITFLLGSCAILLGACSARAQDLPPIGGGVAVAAPAAPAGPNLFTMLLPPPEMRERCRQKLCKCELIKMLRAGMAPASLATGGLIPVGNCCPAVTKEALAKPADSADGAAARIKKDLEESKERRASVRFLGTVDCRYWPEAEEALINALRADRIECVRYEAALQLQRGCCCTKKIAKALTISIEGTDKDGFPAERSCRVQEAAAIALSMCSIEEPVPEPVKGGEKEPAKKQQARVNPKDFYKDVDDAPAKSIYDGARKALEKRPPVNSTQIISHSHKASSQGILGIFTHAFESTNETPANAPAATKEPQSFASYPQMQQPQRRGLLNKLFAAPAEETTVTTQPATFPTPVTTAQPRSTQPTGAIRPVSYTTPVTTDEPAFSTAAPTTSAPAPRRPAPLPPVTSNNPPRADQGLLGFVIMDDAARR